MRRAALVVVLALTVLALLPSRALAQGSAWSSVRSSP